MSSKDKSKSSKSKSASSSSSSSSSSNSSVIDVIWPRLKRGIDRLFRSTTNVEDEKLATDPKEWMEMYTLIVQYCTSVQPIKSEYASYNSIDKLVSNPRTEFMGEELYERLSGYIQARVFRISSKCIRIVDQELFLKSLTDEWIKYNKVILSLDRLFSYLNRNWIKQAQERKRPVYTIYELGRQQWKMYFFMNSLGRLTNDILELVDLIRSKKKDVDKKQIDKLVDMYTRMLVDNSDKKPDSAAAAPGDGSNAKSKAEDVLYNDIFINEYIRRMRLFYASKFETIRGDPVRLALLALGDLDNETEISSFFIRAQSLEGVNDNVVEIIVDKYIDNYVDGFNKSILSGDEEGAGILFRVVSKSKKKESIYDRLVDSIKVSAALQGKAALERIALDFDSNPFVYPETVINLWLKGKKLVENSLGNMAKFSSALGTSFVAIINDNPFFDKRECEQKSAEIFARYLDSILKKQNSKNGKKPLAKDEVIRMMEILPYVNEKDTFLLIYSRLLSKRLMQNSSVSIASEKDAVLKMSLVCGKDYTRKLVTMFNDLEASQRLTDEFMDTPKWNALNMQIDVKFLVLTQNCWMIPPPASEFKVPKELSLAEEVFESYYLKENNRRRLVWQHNLSKGELTTSSFALPSGGTPSASSDAPSCYTIVCPAYQMAVLLYFNQFKSGTFVQLCDYTMISQQTMESVLYPLVLLRILLLDGSTRFTKFTKKSVFELNPKFVGKKTKIGLALVAPPQVKKGGPPKAHNDDDDDDDGNDGKDLKVPSKSGASEPQADNVDEDDDAVSIGDQIKELEAHRVTLTEAAIMRILKREKVMTHHNLYDAASKELSIRFKPTQKVYKKSIASLIEKEFIEKKKNEHADVTYSYI